MIAIGIDPGASGGIARVGPGESFATRMPGTEADIWEQFRGRDVRCYHAFIEQVHAMPGQGVSSTFKFGASYGALRMALVAAGIPFEAVSPGKWQREFGLVFTKAMGLSPTEKKRRHKARAQELFPAIKVTLATCDALLIAEWGRRQLAARGAA